MHRPSLPRALALPLLVLVPFVVLLVAVLAVDGAPLGVDTWWAGAVAGAPGLTPAARLVSELGGGVVGGVEIPAALAALVWWLRSRAAALVLVGGGVLSLAATQVTKHLLGRPRPPTAGMPGSFDSFPSGHVANATTLALLLVLLLGVRWLWPLAVVWPGAMLLSRTVLGVHWLSDTVAAASLGAAAALVTVLLARRFVPQALPARPRPAVVASRPPGTAALVRVPQVTAVFWVLKALSTALGESTSDWSVQTLGPVPAVLAGLVLFVVALTVQLRARRYVPARYWSAVVALGVFGTMGADVVHVGFGVPYAVSSAAYLALLAGVLVVWARVEGTLDVHEVTTTRRELFYWATVVATFAAGTAVGDLVATTTALGYAGAVLLFAVLLAVPWAGYRLWGWNGVAAFWTAYVLTRPLGASVADLLGKPTADGGLGVGQGVVTAVLAAAIVVGVALHTRRARAPLARVGVTP